MLAALAALMTLLAHHSILLLSSVVLISVGCSSTDYGSPTSATTIGVQEDGGFSTAEHDRGVTVVGTAATYSVGTLASAGTVTTASVTAMIHALEAIDFLDLDGDYTQCPNPAADHPNVTIHVALPAGTKTVLYNANCSSGTFDQLANLDQQIFELSGFTAWSASQ